MMILMNCDRTLRKKTEWEYQRNRNFVFGISAILYSSLPHPFLGNCEMAVSPVQKKKKKDLNFKFFFLFLLLFLFLKVE